MLYMFMLVSMRIWLSGNVALAFNHSFLVFPPRDFMMYSALSTLHGILYV